MKYRLRARVEGYLFLSEPRATITAQRGDLAFELESDERKRVVAISVSAPIPADKVKSFFATMTPTPDQIAKVHVHFSTDGEFHRQLIKELQEIESLLTLNCAFRFEGNPLKRIRWHEAEHSLMPETPEEEARVQFSGFSTKRQFPPTPAVVKPSSFQLFVSTAPQYQSVIVPAAFWRQGNNHLDAGDFVQAFYNHYAVIEDMFADGKTSEGQVLKAFASSAELCEICSLALPHFFGPGDRHEKALREFFVNERCETTVAGLQRFLFRIRGNMHHYFGKSSRPHPTPFNQTQFESIVLLVMYLATLALTRRVIQINQQNPLTPPQS